MTDDAIEKPVYTKSGTPSVFNGRNGGNATDGKGSGDPRHSKLVC
jgi:hypothetical protein